MVLVLIVSVMEDFSMLEWSSQMTIQIAHRQFNLPLTSGIQTVSEGHLHKEFIVSIFFLLAKICSVSLVICFCLCTVQFTLMERSVSRFFIPLVKILTGMSLQVNGGSLFIRYVIECFIKSWKVILCGCLYECVVVHDIYECWISFTGISLLLCIS